MKPNVTATILNQWREIRIWAMAAVLLFLLTVDGTALGQVTNIIYQDAFGRVGLLNGSTPSPVDNYYTNSAGGYYTNANSDATWWANTNLTPLFTDGSEIAYTNFPNPTNGFFMNGFLPFTPQIGHVYTFNVSLLGVIGGNNWLACGYALNAITNNYYAAATCGEAWLLSRASDAGAQLFTGPGTGGATTISFPATGNFISYSIVLDTTKGNASGGWVASWYVNGTLEKTATYSPNPTTIRWVGIGGDGATGYFTNFNLVDVIPPSSSPVINEQPQGVTAQVGQTATFWVNATGLPSPTYQWRTNSVGGITNNITGAISATYTTPVLTPAYNGLQYSVTVGNFIGSTNSAPATVTVLDNPPTVFSAAKTGSGTNVVVRFSGVIDPTTGLNAANYSLNNGATVNSAVFGGAASNSVILTTSALSTNTSYTLAVENVQDLFGDVMTNVSVPVLPAGLVLFLRPDSGVVLDNNGLVDEWLDQSTNGNNAVQYLNGISARPGIGTINGSAALTFNGNNSNYLTAASSPSLAIISNMTIYAVADFADFNANREVVSKAAGNVPAPYDYFADASPAGTMAYYWGNGAAQGHDISTASINAGTPYVVSLSLVATNSENSFATHYLNGIAGGSGQITLNQQIADSGLPLYVGGRNDMGQFMNGQMGAILIFNQALSAPDRTNVDNYLGAKYFSLSFATNLPATTTSSNGFSVTYTIYASQGSAHFTFQWMENGTNIPGATGQTYTTPVLGPGDNGDTFYVVVTSPNGSTTTSVTNTLTVLNEPPYVTATGIPIWNTNQIVVLFDEAVDPATATIAANYSLNNGASVHSAAIGDAPNKIILTTSALTWNANPDFYTLAVQNVQDLYGNTMSSGTTPVGLYPLQTVLWLKAGTGVVTDSGGVNTWNDQSGLQDDVFQPFGPPNEPQLATDNHGLPTLQFVGTNNEYLFTANDNGNDYPPLEITGDLSIFTVVNFAGTGGANGEMVSKTGLQNTLTKQGNIPASFDYYNGSGANLYRGNGGTGGVGISYGVSTAATAPSVGNAHVLGVTETGNTVSHYVDGNAAGVSVLNDGYQASSDADQGQPLYIGGRSDAVNHLTGNMSEFILIASPLDSNDTVSLENYLGAKYTVPLGTNSYPAITQQPVASTNVGLYSTVVIPAAVSGNPLALQWYDTNNIAQTGQTAATLAINDFRLNDSYYFVATNIYGAITSSVVAVNIFTNATPTKIGFAMMNNQLTLSWPSDHTGWQLQAQTNSTAVGISTNWDNVTGSSVTNTVVIPVNLTNGTVFYRLVFP